VTLGIPPRGPGIVRGPGPFSERAIALRISSWLLGAAGLLLTVASWTSEPIPITVDLIFLLALCGVGGMLPLRLPGLQPMPLSLPLVGAMAIASEASAAMTMGFVAGAFTAFAPRRPGDEREAPPSTPEALRKSFALAGLLALGAGMVASGYTRFGLMSLDLTAPFNPPLLESLRSLSFSALVFWLAWCAARLIEQDLRAAAAPRTLGLSLIGAAMAAAGAQVLASSRAAWGDRLVVGVLAACSAVLVPLAWRLVRQERDLASLRARARTGIALVESIALAIEAKDHTSERHLRRMRVYCLDLGRRLGLPERELESLEYAALLHDIGKLVVPESILSKPSSLSKEEYELMAAHAKVGAEILESTSLSSHVAQMVRHHHERYDGSGYPDGLMGMEIPLGSRILAAVDTFEALTSDRPHRQGMPAAQAAAWVESQAGILFDPRVTEILVRHHASMEQQVAAEEAARAGHGERSPAETVRRGRPVQAVLDRITTSHMEVYSLHEISQVLGQTLSLEESCRLVAGKLERLIHYSACAIYLVDPENNVLWTRFAAGAGADRVRGLKIPIGSKVSGWSAANRRAIATWPRVSDPPSAPATCPDLLDAADDPAIAPLASAVVAPLMVEETVLGVIALYDDARHAYSDQEEQLLSLVARQVAGAVRSGLLLEQTQENALTDSLTGLPNARYMFMAFDQEASRARQDGHPLTLLVMDIDGFREINDDFGHHAGDRYLIGMAKAIRSQMRICDTCIRYAGDEFVAILPRLGSEEIDAVLERLTEAARDYSMEARPGRAVRLNLSLGCATMPADGEDFETLMKVATSRMQQAKGRRGDRSARARIAIQASLLPGGGRETS
jgi:diguanylate cyclase (GGDEF)-like protein/putative nucleotidyltransferase with HDIG domain